VRVPKRPCAFCEPIGRGEAQQKGTTEKGRCFHEGEGGSALISRGASPRRKGEKVISTRKLGSHGLGPP